MAEKKKKAKDFIITILGCGSAIPTRRHRPPAQAISLRDKLYMVDCGEGAQLQMRKYRISFSKLTHIFISHIHADHCLGLPGLLSSLALLGRIGDLVIHGPQEIGGFIEYIKNTFCKDAKYDIRFEEVSMDHPSLVMEDHSVCVYAIPLSHRVNTCGYLFEEKPKEGHIIREMIDFYQIPVRWIPDLKKGADYVSLDGLIVPNERLVIPADPPRRYAYISDTSYLPSILPLIEGVDILYHEATFAESELQRSKDTFHSTAQQAATIARDAHVGQLVIGHYSARYDDVRILCNEAKEIFPRTTLAQEGIALYP